MRTFIILCLILSSFNLFSQDWVTYQNSNIYSKNRVSSRTSKIIERAPGLGEEINDKFNAKGQLVEYELRLCGTSQLKIKYGYNDNNELSREDYFYGRIEGEKTNFTYYSNGKLKSKKRFRVNNKLKVLTSLTYSPNTVEIKEYDSKGNQERIEKFVFERNRIPNLFTGKDFVGNRVSSWKYEFKNKFNDNDQLIWRKNKNTGEITKFTYNEKGLLIRMTTTINIGGHISKETTVFTYKYFKKK